MIFKGYKFNVSNNSIISIGNPRFIKQLKEYTLNYISTSHNDYYNLDENYNVKTYGGKRNNPDDSFEYYHFIDFDYGYNNTNIPKIDFETETIKDEMDKDVNVVSQITFNPKEFNPLENGNINISTFDIKDRMLLTEEIINEIQNNPLFYYFDLSLIENPLLTKSGPSSDFDPNPGPSSDSGPDFDSRFESDYDTKPNNNPKSISTTKDHTIKVPTTKTEDSPKPISIIIKENISKINDILLNVSKTIKYIYEYMESSFNKYMEYSFNKSVNEYDISEIISKDIRTLYEYVKDMTQKYDIHFNEIQKIKSKIINSQQFNDLINIVKHYIDDIYHTYLNYIYGKINYYIQQKLFTEPTEFKIDLDNLKPEYDKILNELGKLIIIEEKEEMTGGAGPSDQLMNYYKLIKIAQNFTLLKEKLVDKYIQAIQDDLGKLEVLTVKSVAAPKVVKLKIEDFVEKYITKMTVLSYYNENPIILSDTINKKLDQLVNVFRAYNYCYSVLQKDKSNPDYKLEETQEAPEFDDRWVNFEYQPSNLYFETEFVGGADFDEIFNIQKKQKGGAEENPEYFKISMFNDLEITDSLINFILEGYNIDIVNFTVGQPNFINYMRSLTQFYFEPIGDEIPENKNDYYPYRALLKPMDIINDYFQNNIHELIEKQTNEQYKYDNSYDYNGNSNIQFNIMKNNLNSKQDTREGGSGKIYGGVITNLSQLKKLIKRVYNIDDKITIITKENLKKHYITILSTEKEKEKLILDPITILMFNNKILNIEDINVILKEISNDVINNNKSKLVYMIKQLNDWGVVQKWCDEINIKLNEDQKIESSGEDDKHKYTKSICSDDKDKCKRYYENYPSDQN